MSWIRDAILYGILAAIITVTIIGQERNRLRNELVDAKRELFMDEVRDFMNKGNRYTAEDAYDYCLELSKHAIILGEKPLDCDSLLGGGK